MAQDLQGGDGGEPVTLKLAAFMECLQQQPTREHLLPCVKRRLDWVLVLLQLDGSCRECGTKLLFDVTDLNAEDAKIVQVLQKTTSHLPQHKVNC